jgi:transcriptional regulator with XRE-family HTH domain
MELGMFLRRRRLELNLSQQKVEQAAGMRRYKLSTLEGGKAHASKNVLERLSAVLKCEIPPDLLPDCGRRKGFI